jgi:hypothetical protein
MAATWFVRRGAPLYEWVDGEVVMVDLEQGAYYALGDVGSQVWKLIAEPHSLDEVCAALVSEFVVEPDVCRTQIATFLQTLLDAQLVDAAG